MENRIFHPTVQVDTREYEQRKRVRKSIEQQLKYAENTLRHAESCHILSCISGCHEWEPDKIVSGSYIVAKMADAALDDELPGTHTIENRHED